jgi:hypothetical protein
MLCPYCHHQISADGACSCHSQAGKLAAPAPQIRTSGTDSHEAGIRAERLPFRGLELPIP